MRNEVVLNEQKVLGRDFIIYGTVEEPLFIASDIAEWIQHSNVTEMLKNVDDDEKLTSTILRAGQSRQVNMLTENGLYEVLMLSRKPIAKQFKSEIKKILKSIRKSGGYITGQEQMSDTELMAKALLVAQKQIEQRNAIIEQQKAKIEADKPKTIFADAVATSKTSILVGDLAKLICQNGYQIGQKRLFDWMRENGYLIKTGSSKNMPTQRYVEQGLFEIKESNVQNPDGSVRITKTTKVTGKGQIYFVNKFTR